MSGRAAPPTMGRAMSTRLLLVLSLLCGLAILAAFAVQLMML